MSKMSSLERVATAVQLKEPDSVPVITVIMIRALREVGALATYDNLRDADLMAQAKLEAFKTFGGDGVMAGTGLHVEAEALGCGMEYLEEEIPVVIERPLEENPDFSRLPELAPGSGRVDAVTGEVRIISSELGSTVLVGSAFSGPFTTAMELRGLPQALEDMEDNPDYLRGLMDFTTKQITRYVDLLMEAGAVGLVMLEPLCSADCMPPDIYKKWALPWQSQIFEYIKDKGRVPVIHICTYTEPLWEAMAGSGALAYHGDIHPSLLECKKEIGAKICLIGNVNPVDVLLNGTPEQVAAASERCIRQAAPGGGFVLAAGCDTGYRTPGENLAAMVETARRSTYPLA